MYCRKLYTTIIIIICLFDLNLWKLSQFHAVSLLMSIKHIDQLNLLYGNEYHI